MKTKHQKFENVVMSRDQIKTAPFNPRIISKQAQGKLKAKIRQVGLLQPIVYNKRTGYLVSGHQRLEILDQLERKQDYELDVAVVDLSEAEEKEMVVFFNNPSAMGEWDLDILADLNLDCGISFDSMGFDKFDVDMLFDGDSRFSQKFEDTTEISETHEKLDAVKESRKQSVDGMKEKNDAGFYFVVVCDSREEKELLLKKLFVPVVEQFVPGFVVNEAVDAKFGKKKPGTEPGNNDQGENCSQ